MSWDLSGLTRYVEQCDVELIRKSIFTKSPVINSFPNWITGIKTEAPIGLLSISPNLGDCECKFTDNTDVAVTERKIKVACIQSGMTICDNDLKDYFLGKELRMGAGVEKISQKLYKEFVDGLMENIRKKTDILVFQGDTESANQNLNKFDGILKIIDADTPEENKFDIETGNCLSATLLLCTQITGEMYDRGNLILLVDPKIQASLAMAAFNACPCAPGQSMENYNLLPNGMKLMACEGLRDTGKVIIVPLDTIVVGTDFGDDREKFDFWWDKSDQIWKMIVKFFLGIQLALPEEVIVGTYAPEVISSVSMGQVDVKQVS